MANRFSLLRLPFVALQEALAIMRPFEIINLSKTSSRFNRFLSQLSGLGKYAIRLRIGDEPNIMIIGTELLYKYKMTFNEDDNEAEKCYHEYGENYEELSVYSEDPFRLQREYCEYLKNVLKISRFEIRYCFEKHPERNQEIIDWMSTQFPYVSECCCFGHGVRHKDLSYFFQKMKGIGKLHTEVITNELLPYKIPQALKRLAIQRGKWIKWEEFMEFNSVEMALWDTSLTNQDINRFLKMWINLECNQSLKNIFMSVKGEEDFLPILKGVEYQEMDPPRKLKLGPYNTMINPGVEIKRSDGTILVVFLVQKGRWLHVEMRVFDN